MKGINIAVRAGLIWLVIACFAVVNGVVRESILLAVLGAEFALSLSGILLCIIVFAVTYVCFSFLTIGTKQHARLIGVQWFVMTLVFEFSLGFAVEKS